MGYGYYLVVVRGYILVLIEMEGFVELRVFWGFSLLFFVT